MPIVKINAISVPPQAGPELEQRFGARADDMAEVPGFRGFQLLRPTAGEERYFVVTHWEDEAAFDAWNSGAGERMHTGERRKPVSTGADLLEFDLVLDVPGSSR